MSNKIIQIKDGSDNVLPINNEGTSGYCKMADGTLMQWGVLINTSSGYTSITYNISFVDDSYVFMATPRYSDSYPKLDYRTIAQKSGLSAGVVNFKPLSSTGSYTTAALADWFAIGRWK